MSTRSTILLTDDNQHWYQEHLTGEIILEFSQSNTFYKKPEGGVVIHIPEGSPLWVSIAELLNWPEKTIQDAKKRIF